MSCCIDPYVIHNPSEITVERLMNIYRVIRELNDEIRLFELEVENHIDDLIKNNDYKGPKLADYFKTKMTEASNNNNNQNVPIIYYKIAWMEGNNKAVLKFQETHPEAPKLTVEI